MNEWRGCFLINILSRNVARCIHHVPEPAVHACMPMPMPQIYLAAKDGVHGWLAGWAPRSGGTIRSRGMEGVVSFLAS